jgi:hypothetical protein
MATLMPATKRPNPPEKRLHFRAIRPFVKRFPNASKRTNARKTNKGFARIFGLRLYSSILVSLVIW